MSPNFSSIWSGVNEVVGPFDSTGIGGRCGLLEPGAHPVSLRADSEKAMLRQF
jgi:hypothetical protein